MGSRVQVPSRPLSSLTFKWGFLIHSMPQYFTYIIFSPSHQVHYKGMTSYPEKRLWQHNNSKSRYTSGKEPWELVYLKAYPTKREALMAEKKLKKAGKDYLLTLIKTYQENK